MKTELCNEKLQHANIYVLAELSEGSLKYPVMKLAEHARIFSGIVIMSTFIALTRKIQKSCLIFYQKPRS